MDNEDGIKQSRKNGGDDVLQYRELVDSMHPAFGIVDTENVFTYVNKMFGELLGYTSEEAIGKSIYFFLNEENKQILEHNVRERREGKSTQYELSWTAKNGEQIPTIVSGAPLTDEKGNHRGSFAVITDIRRRKQIEEELKNSEERYKTLFHETPIGIVHTDIKGNILSINKTALEIIGFSNVEEIKKINLLEYKPLQKIRLLENMKDCIENSMSCTEEGQYKTSWGKTLQIRYRINPITNDDREVTEVLIAFDDLSDIREVERGLEEAKENYRTLVEESLQGITVIQAERYAFVNKAFALMLGYTPEEIMKMNPEDAWNLVHPDDKDFLLQIADDRKEGRPVPTPYQYRFVSKEGHVKWVEAFSKVIEYEGARAVQVIVIDITDRKLAEMKLHSSREKIKRSEEKYRALAEYSLQGMNLLTDEGFVYVNQTFASMVGRSVDELMSMNFEEIWEKLVHPDDRKQLRERIQARIDGQTLTPRHQYRLLKKDGTSLWVETYTTTIEYQGETAIQTVLIDVSDRRRVEVDLRTEKDRAKLYLDLMGHDIRNQMQVIMNSATLLKNATDESVKDSFLKVIEESVQRCSRLIEEVKATEHLLAAPLSERSLREAIEMCVSALDTRTQNVEFHLDLIEAETLVLADEFLELMITNFLMNAIEHNPKEKKNIWVQLTKENKGYTISIADDGPGISDIRKKQLFDMSRRFGGVGLHQSGQIIEKYGGTVAVEDRIEDTPEKGARFVIWLPIKEKTNS